jgi:hypothetical protein
MIISSNKKKFIKNTSSILREFDEEKWKQILPIIKKKNISIDDVDNFFVNYKKKRKFFYKNKIYFGNNKDIINKHINYYHKIINKFYSPEDTIIELGAGYGSKLIRLKKKKPFVNAKMIGLDISKNGQIALKLLSKNKIKTGYCNFFNYEIKNITIPKNSIIFTSYALHYVPKYNEKIVVFFKKMSPKIIINFEPIFEINNKFKINKKIQNYINKNNYNQNFLSCLLNAEKKNKIKILKIEKNILSVNYLLPISMIIWKINK